MGVRMALAVLSLFAAAWACAALRFSGAAPPFLIVPIAISLALLALGWRGSRAFQSRGRHVGKLVALWTSIEMIALVVTANVLENQHRADLMLPLGAIIVGLHFFPLARGIPVRLYHSTGAGMLVAGVAGLLVPAAERQMVAGMGAALVLWATALVIVLRGRRAVAQASPA